MKKESGTETSSSVSNRICGKAISTAALADLGTNLDPSIQRRFAIRASIVDNRSVRPEESSRLRLSLSWRARIWSKYNGITDMRADIKEGMLREDISSEDIVIIEAASDPGSGLATGSRACL